MDIIDERNVVIQPLSAGWVQGRAGAVDMLRLDLLHDVVSGNKWYKLRLNMHHAIERGYKSILTFGGGYSNHLVAAAFTAKQFGLRSVGIVRGRYEQLTPTLQRCVQEGMELHFVTQEDYKNKHQPDWAAQVVAGFDEILIIPEGGANEWGRNGAALIGRFIKAEYSHVVLAVGTGTTLIGLRRALDVRQQILGMVPMKKGSYLAGDIAAHLPEGQDRNWHLRDEWHFGGFGKWKPELLEFMNDFYSVNTVPLDVVYTGKMMYGVHQMLLAGSFTPDARILCVHSGGLQGNASVAEQLIF